MKHYQTIQLQTGISIICLLKKPREQSSYVNYDALKLKVEKDPITSRIIKRYYV